jgi:hypothetical protein
MQPQAVPARRCASTLRPQRGSQHPPLRNRPGHGREAAPQQGGAAWCAPGCDSAWGAASTQTRCGRRGTFRHVCSCPSAETTAVGQGRRGGRGWQVRMAGGGAQGVTAHLPWETAPGAVETPHNRAPAHPACLFHVWAGDPRIVVEAGVAAHRLLARMRKGADRPVVHKALGARDDLQARGGRQVSEGAAEGARECPA